MRSAELAAAAIVQAFHREDLSRSSFLAYATQLRLGTASLLAFIKRFYEPAFLDLFFSSTPPVRLYNAVVWVLSGAAYDHRPLWLRSDLACFFTAVRLRKAWRWATHLPVESRWRW